MAPILYPLLGYGLREPQSADTYFSHISIFSRPYPLPTPRADLPSFVYSHSEETGGVPFIAHTISGSRASRSSTLSKTFQTQWGKNGAHESISGPYLDSLTR